MQPLIYDVGVNDGSDSAYYLRKGYRVVGVEAHPGLADQLRVRFAREIAAGQYVLLNVGIADREGRMQFWICDDLSEWSSFDRSIASRNGSRHHAVDIPTVRFASILSQHGVPHYLKIDIEGHDRLCLEDLTAEMRPQHVSIEMSHADGIADIERLRNLGYRRFKVISQVSRSPAMPKLLGAIAPLPYRVRRQVMKLQQAIAGVSSDAGWAFPSGSSGPFGDATPGRWLSSESAIAQWRALSAIARRRGALGNWFDVHATV